MRAALLAESRNLLRRLDSLCAGRDTEALPEAEHGADDRRRIRALLQLLHEGPIDLDLVEREAAEIAERRIAGPEIIHGNAQSQPSQIVQSAEISLDVAQEEGLGDLDLKAARGKAGFPQHSRDPLRQIMVPELGRRDVDRDVDVVGPLLGVPTGLPEHPFAELNDDAGLFREGNKIERWNQPS